MSTVTLNNGIYRCQHKKGTAINIEKSTIDTAAIQFSTAQEQIHIDGRGKFYANTKIQPRHLNGKCKNTTSANFNCDFDLGISSLFFFTGSATVRLTDPQFGSTDHTLAIPLGWLTRLGALSLFSIIAVTIVLVVIIFLLVNLWHKGNTDRKAKKQAPHFELVTSYEVTYQLMT